MSPQPHSSGSNYYYFMTFFVQICYLVNQIADDSRINGIGTTGKQIGAQFNDDTFIKHLKTIISLWKTNQQVDFATWYKNDSVVYI